jgi:hypothetical protein
MTSAEGRALPHFSAQVPSHLFLGFCLNFALYSNQSRNTAWELKTNDKKELGMTF